ncbi:MAG: sugar phosphate isomerase/epimerase [Acidobacteria bacterium]|nr:sugar phosphate isomerase/epimerase [Acidobacteriota bacterium]
MIALAAITDEFSPDLDRALDGMASVGMTGAELRVIDGRNILELGPAEVDDVRRRIAARGLSIVGIASPLLKCVLPDAPPVDARLQQDVFGAPYTYDDQPRLSERALDIAERMGARVIRVFSYWRTVEPEETMDRVGEALAELAERAARRGLIIGLENEAACNVGTGAETARVLDVVGHPALGVVWDPANATLLGETPYPDGYGALPAGRIVHVHAKDCRVPVQAFTPEWGPIGEMGVDWRGQIAALVRDGYAGWISLETHWRGPRGDKFEASVICGERLAALVGRAG